MRKFLISVSCVLCVLEFTQLFSVEESAPMRNNRPLLYARDRKNDALKDGVVIAKKADEDSGDPACQSHLEYEPTAIVNNCVNVITGLYMDFEVDYAIPGAEPFSFQRCYISAPGDEESPLGNGWSRNYFGMIEKYKDEGAKREKRVYVHDSFGSMYHYGRYSDCYKLFRECYKTHVTNCSTGMMSARTNILNNKLKFEKKSKGIFTKCNGEKLTFKKMEYDEKQPEIN